MKRTTIVLVLTLFIRLAGGSLPEPAEAASSWSLDDLAWLVGGTWIAESQTAAGAPATTEIIYRWASGKKAIAYSLVRRVQATGAIDTTLEGICGWHPEKRRLLLWELDSQGNLAEGVFGEAGRLDEVIYSADGTALPVRSAIVREAENRFAFTASVERDGEWVVVFEAKYRRDTGN